MRIRSRIIDFLKTKNYYEEEAVRIYYVIMAFILLAVSMLAEIFIFNCKHWTSLGNNPQLVSFTDNGSLFGNGDGTYEVIGDEINIEINDINQKLSSLFVEIVDIDNIDSDNGSIITVDFDAKDTSHHNYYSLNRRTLSSREPRSNYITMHLYGDAKAVKIRPYVETGHTILVNLVLNPVFPVFIMWERVVLLYGILLIILFCNPYSALHKIKYVKLPLGKKYTALCIFLLVNALILYWVNGVNPFYQGEYGINTMQYQELAEAFKEGQVSLLTEPTKKLEMMDNPYDMGYRDEVMEFSEYYFDHAYYDGKYYVYFGVVPCVLLYFPYYLITGEHIHNHTVCYIGILLILLGILLLMDELIHKYYKKCSAAEWFLLTELFILGSYVTYVTKRPDLYSVPIIYAVAFALCGLWAFLKAVPNTKNADRSLNKGYLIAGSIITTLIVGCRPQLFLVIALDVIVLKDYAFSLEYLKSSDGRKSLLSVFLPMLTIGSLFMIYNYRRFGSLFDFGAFYNLTFNDMRYRGYVWDRIPYGTFVYLFHPMEMIPEYPYFGNIEQYTKYMGVTIQETTYGGVFFSSPFAIVAMSSLLFAKKMKRKMIPWLLSIAGVIAALIIMVFDTTNSGILARYFFDFSFLWMLGAVLSSMIVLGMKELRGTTTRNAFLRLLIFFVIFEVIYQILVFMLDSGDYLKGNRADLFYHYYYMFGFGI